jgi:tRNA threonylcarbamoyladenosine biosynthesis protein TsaE
MANSELTSLTIDVSHVDSLLEAALEILKFADDHKVWALYGEMGAGKTTFVKAVGESLEIVDMVNSPTFSIVNEYRNVVDEVFYHFDFYRIEKEEEARDIGAEDYFYSGDYCFIEWPSLIPSLLPDKYMAIDIEIIDQEKRRINCTKHG